MTSNIVPYNFESHAVRTEVVDGEPWFCAKDVCDLLGHSNSRQALSDMCKQPGVRTAYIGVSTGKKANGEDALQRVPFSFINESNLYRLIMRSRKPEAERFSDWVVEEVLPSIRKTGQYAPRGYMFNPRTEVLEDNQMVVYYPFGRRDVRIMGFDDKECLFCFDDVSEFLWFADPWSEALDNFKLRDCYTRLFKEDGRDEYRTMLPWQSLYHMITLSRNPKAHLLTRWLWNDVGIYLAQVRARLGHRLTEEDTELF